ncbi:MAG: hypothetical protein F4109_00965 [Gammaproteobacteria bacterium]|nr:hypothetical protein [Gammaproteobacteria bacterium]
MSASWDSAARVFTFQLHAYTDIFAEGDETFTLKLVDSDNASRAAEFNFTVKDGPGPVVSLDLASGARVPEGVPARFRLGLRPALPYAVHVAVLVREEGTAFDNGAPDPYPGHVLPRHRGEFVVEIPANASNAVHSVPTRSQSFLERDTTVHLLVMKPTAGVRSIARNLPASRGGGVELGSYVTDGANTATVTVLDGNDSPSAVTPEVRLHVHPEDTEVAEGGTIEFWLAMKPQPASDLAVNIDIAAGVKPNSNVGECGQFLAAGEAGRRTVTVPGYGGGLPRQSWNWVRFTVPTVDDSADEHDCDVVATILADSSYRALNAYQDKARVRVTDNDEAGSSQDSEVVRPVVTLTRDAASVTEGGEASFTLTADRRPPDPLPVWVDYKETRGSGETRRVSGGSAQVVIPRRGLSVTWTLATEDDEVWLGGGEATATLRAGDGYLVGEPSSAAVAIIEDDPQEEMQGSPPDEEENSNQDEEVEDSNQDEVGNPPPDEEEEAPPASVESCVSDDLLATAERLYDQNRHRPPKYAENWFSVLVAFGARDASQWTADGRTISPMTSASAKSRGWRRFAAALECLEGAASMPLRMMSFMAPAREPEVPALSVDDATANESDGAVRFTVRLSAPAEGFARVRYEARESEPSSARRALDFIAESGSVRFEQGDTEQEIVIRILDDSIDEGAETFELALSDPAGAVIGDGLAVGTIVNTDPMPGAWLGRFGRAVAGQALDGVADRMAAPREPGAQGAIAGYALSFDSEARSATDGAPASAASGAVGGQPLALSGLAHSFAHGFGAPGGRFGAAAGPAGAHRLGGSYGMTLQDVLLGSSFTATGAADSRGGSLALWGRSAQSSFAGGEGGFSLSGETASSMLGADYARGRWLAGLALLRSAGEGGYPDAGADHSPLFPACPGGMEEELCGGTALEGDGAVKASLTAAVPYAAFKVSERLKLWGALGYGAGEVALEPDSGVIYEAGIGWTMAALGLRGGLTAPPKAGSGLSLALTSDALYADTSSDGTNDLAPSASGVSRLRLGLEGRYRIALAGGGSITPRIEVGARHDGGEAGTGFGVELGGGVAWVHPQAGISLELSGRALIAHGNNDIKDRGFAASLAWDPAPATKRGPSLTLRQDWGGRARGGLDALFASDVFAGWNRGHAVQAGYAPARWTAELGYGLPAFGGRFVGMPQLSYGASYGAREMGFGWRLTPDAAHAPDLSFGFKAARRESEAAPPEHMIGLELTARW